MTTKEKQLRQLAVDTINSWLRYSTSNGKHKTIIDTYNSQKPLPSGYKVTYTDAWCATTVSAVGVKLGLTDTILPECSCNRMIKLYQAINRWEENDAYTPNIGDLMLYDWDDNGVGDNVGETEHIGMVTKVDGKNITVTEGNYSGAVKQRSMKVNGKYIRGYCLPDYGKASKTYNFSKTTQSIKTNSTTNTTSTATKVKVKSISMVSARVPKVQFGDENDAVKIMQILLTSLGYDCKGNDGSFGNNTLTALKAYQSKMNISATGVCGKDTWPCLLQGKK